MLLIARVVSYHPEKSVKIEKIRQIDPKCTKCMDLDKKLLKAESRIINLCIENAKLKTALNSLGMQNNSCRPC